MRPTTMDRDLRLIEDHLPIETISAEASREKLVRKGHISTLHVCLARRPLVSCRAAVYGSMLPARPVFVLREELATVWEECRHALGRA